MSETKYLYSFDNSIFKSNEYDSKEEAIEKAKIKLKLKKGDKILIGKQVELNKKWLFENISIIDGEDIRERMYQEVGEVAEGWLNDLDEKKINGILIDYLYQHHAPSFFLIEDIEEVTIN